MKKDILTETLLLSTYDLDYEVSDTEAFIDEFNKKKLKKLEDKIKEREDESNKIIKELEDKIKVKEEESNKKIKELEDKIKEKEQELS